MANTKVFKSKLRLRSGNKPHDKAPASWPGLLRACGGWGARGIMAQHVFWGEDMQDLRKSCRLAVVQAAPVDLTLTVQTSETSSEIFSETFLEAAEAEVPEITAP